MSERWARAARHRLGAAGGEAGYDAGHRAGYAAAFAEHQELRERIAMLADAAAAIEPVAAPALTALLAEAVERLVAGIVGDAGVDPDLLRRRAAALIDAVGPVGAPVLHAHPDDLGVLDGCATPLAADPTLAPGNLRVVWDGGEMEDGIAAAFRRMRDALAGGAA